MIGLALRRHAPVPSQPRSMQARLTLVAMQPINVSSDYIFCSGGFHGHRRTTPCNRVTSRWWLFCFGRDHSCTVRACPFAAISWKRFAGRAAHRTDVADPVLILFGISARTYRAHPAFCAVIGARSDCLCFCTASMRRPVHFAQTSRINSVTPRIPRCRFRRPCLLFITPWRRRLDPWLMDRPRAWHPSQSAATWLTFRLPRQTRSRRLLLALCGCSHRRHGHSLAKRGRLPASPLTNSPDRLAKAIEL